MSELDTSDSNSSDTSSDISEKEEVKENTTKKRKRKNKRPKLVQKEDTKQKTAKVHRHIHNKEDNVKINDTPIVIIMPSILLLPNESIEWFKLLTIKYKQLYFIILHHDDIKEYTLFLENNADMKYHINKTLIVGNARPFSQYATPPLSRLMINTKLKIVGDYIDIVVGPNSRTSCSNYFIDTKYYKYPNQVDDIKQCITKLVENITLKYNKYVISGLSNTRKMEERSLGDTAIDRYFKNNVINNQYVIKRPIFTIPKCARYKNVNDENIKTTPTSILYNTDPRLHSTQAILKSIFIHPNINTFFYTSTAPMAVALPQNTAFTGLSHMKSDVYIRNVALDEYYFDYWKKIALQLMVAFETQKCHITNITDYVITIICDIYISEIMKYYPKCKPYVHEYESDLFIQTGEYIFIDHVHDKDAIIIVLIVDTKNLINLLTSVITSSKNPYINVTVNKNSNNISNKKEKEKTSVSNINEILINITNGNNNDNNEDHQIPYVNMLAGIYNQQRSPEYSDILSFINIVVLLLNKIIDYMHYKLLGIYNRSICDEIGSVELFIE